MRSSGVRSVAALAVSLALGLCACPVLDSSPSGSSSGGSSGTGGSGGTLGSGGSGAGLGAKCSGCPRQAPELDGLCLGIGSVCGYQGQSAVRECVDRGGVTGVWTESPMTSDRAKAIESCPDTKPSSGSSCPSWAQVCVACYYSNGCEKPTTTMFCDPDTFTWIQSPMDATNPQITYCTPGSDAGPAKGDSGLPDAKTADVKPADTKKADAVSDPNPCAVSGSPPGCTCTYPDSYAGYAICGYGSNTDPDRYYIWPKSDSRYWGRDVTCAPTSLCELAKPCDFDETKICCSPNNASVWNVECKFADPSDLARRTSCCR